MKVVIDEKVKHRLVGIAVILSIAVVFAPAILKKSQRRLEDTVSLSVKLPPKPSLPKVSVREPDTLFKTVKVAHVEVPPVEKSVLPALTLAKAESLSAIRPSSTSIQVDKSRETIRNVGKELNSPKLKQAVKHDSGLHNPVSQKRVNIHLSQVPPIKFKPISLQRPALIKPQTIIKQSVMTRSKQAYGVQLATFAVHHNAIALVGKLKNKGYQAQYHKVLGKNGVFYYKVVYIFLVVNDD